MQVRSHGACLTLAAAQKLKIVLPGTRKKAQLGLMHSWVVGLSLCTSSALKHKRVQHLHQDLVRPKVQPVLPQMIRNKIILTQLEAVQALQWPWQCDGALAMSLVDKLALVSAVKTRSSPAFTFFACILFV